MRLAWVDRAERILSVDAVRTQLDLYRSPDDTWCVDRTHPSRGCDWSMFLCSAVRSFIYHYTGLAHKHPKCRTSTLKAESACSSETLVYTHRTIWCNIPDYETTFWICWLESGLSDTRLAVRPAEVLVKGNRSTCLEIEPNMSRPWKAEFNLCYTTVGCFAYKPTVLTEECRPFPQLLREPGHFSQ
jgi:hypothetical protein